MKIKKFSKTYKIFVIIFILLISHLISIYNADEHIAQYFAFLLRAIAYIYFAYLITLYAKRIYIAGVVLTAVFFFIDQIPINILSYFLLEMFAGRGEYNYRGIIDIYGEVYLYFVAYVIMIEIILCYLILKIENYIKKNKIWIRS